MRVHEPFFVVLSAAVMAAATAALVIFSLSVGYGPARGDEQKRYNNLPLHEWFDKLTSKRGGKCCAERDGEETEFEMRDGSYWAPIDGVMTRVPDDAVLQERNPLGYAVKWIYNENGRRTFRCFLPGNAT